MYTKAGLLAGLFLLSALAGCISDEADDRTQAADPDNDLFVAVDAAGLPIPVPLCHSLREHPAKATAHQNATGLRCDFEMTPDQGRSGNEVTIAVNPTDPQNVVGGAKDYYPLDAGECVWDGIYVTHDGGRSTFADRSFDGSPWRLLADRNSFEPNYASQFWCTTDPVAYFNTAGELYYLLMAYQADRVTGSKTCEHECPQTPVGGGALNDWAFNRATQIVAVSSDGGDSFHTFTPVLEGTFPVDFHDKGWIAASHDGTIHVMWLAVLAPGNLYFRSTNGGQTFSDPELLAPVARGSGQGSFVDVGTGPEVYAAWYSQGIQLRTSNDYGETWGPQEKVLDTNPQSMPGLSPRDRRTGYPAMATDRNVGSPFADSIYFTWNDACGDAEWKPLERCTVQGANSVYFSGSHDRGQSFSTPVRLSAADVTNGSVDNWSIFPAISVSPGGVIDVSWMDTQNTRTIDGHQTFEQHYTYSLDGGKTWAKPYSVRDSDDGGWDPALSFHQNGNIFIGDYNDIDSSWQAAHPVWPDTRDGHADVYTATLQRPMFAEGWDPTAKAQALVGIEKRPL